MRLSTLVIALAALLLANPLAYSQTQVDSLVKVLTDPDKTEGTRDGALKGLARLGGKAESALPEIVKLLDDSELSQKFKVEVVYVIGTIAEGSKNHGKAAFPAVTKLMDNLNGDSAKELARLPAKILPSFGDLAKQSVPRLLSLVELDEEGGRFYWTALEMLRADPKVAMPVVTKRLKAGERLLPPPFNNVANKRNLKPEYERMYYYFSNLGPVAKDAVPFLIEDVKNENLQAEYRNLAIRILGNIGPDADAALPTLREILKRTDFMGSLLVKQAEEAIEKIKKKK
jgi:hypothetical protein